MFIKSLILFVSVVTLANKTIVIALSNNIDGHDDDDDGVVDSPEAVNAEQFQFPFQQPFNFPILQNSQEKYLEKNQHHSNRNYNNEHATDDNNNYDDNTNNNKNDATNLVYPSSSMFTLASSNRPNSFVMDISDALEEQSHYHHKPKDFITIRNPRNYDEMEPFDEFESNHPYGIQNVVRRDQTRRTTRSHRHNLIKTTFQSLCPTRHTVIPLETISFEYRPDHYEEVTCHYSYAPTPVYTMADLDKNKVCSEAGFECIQLNRTIYLTRRSKGSDCWESETRIVPSGCECMWPKHVHGDILTYHNIKRLNTGSSSSNNNKNPLERLAFY